MNRLDPLLVGLHITILGGFLLVEDVIAQQTFGGARDGMPYVLLYGGLLVTLTALTWYTISDKTFET